MFRSKRTAKLAFGLIATALASSADAAFFSLPRMLGVQTQRIVFDQPVLAPIAHTQFCMQHPADCEIRRSFRAGPISLTTDRWTELVNINRTINRSIAPQRNLGGVMAEERLLSPATGDCNDYAVTKRHELLVHGWPSRALLLSEIVVPSGEHHLVLVVRVKEGDFVLDNLNYGLRPIASTRYQWVRAQSPENPKFWSKVKIAPSSREIAPAAPNVRLTSATRSHFGLAFLLRKRAALALYQSKSGDCCNTDGGRSAEYAVVAERQDQQQ